LEKRDARAARIVDLHFFSGLPLEEIGESLGVTRRTVERDLLSAKLWLKRELSDIRA
jgi:RNA polymerase sigma factor (sigma-70 family)